MPWVKRPQRSMRLIESAPPPRAGRRLRVARDLVEGLHGVRAPQPPERHRRGHPLGLTAGTQLDEGDRLLEGEAHPAVALLAERVLEHLPGGRVAGIAHLGGGGAPGGRVGVDQIALPREGVDQRADRDAQAAPGGDLLERGEVREQRLAVRPGEGLAPVGAEEGHQGLVALGDLVAHDDGLLLAPRERPHVDAALPQGLEQREDLAVAGLAERHRGGLLHRGVGRGHVGDVLGDLGRWTGGRGVACGGCPRALRGWRGGEPRQQREREEKRLPHDVLTPSSGRCPGA